MMGLPTTAKLQTSPFSCSSIAAGNKGLGQPQEQGGSQPQLRRERHARQGFRLARRARVNRPHNQSHDSLSFD
jgi:hypothetical protein